MSHIRVKIFIAAVLNILAAGGMCGYSSQSETEYWNVLSLAYIGIVWAQLFLVIVYAGIYVLSDQQVQTISALCSRMREIYFKEYYAIVIINKSFLLIFTIIMIIDLNTFSFKTYSSYHFSSAFYLSGLLFYFFSKEMFSRRILLPNERMFENEGVFRCAYEVLYYVATFFIVFSFLFVVKFDSIKYPADELTKFLIYSLTYAFYSLTKLGILVNVFLLISFIRLLIDCIQRILDNQNYPFHVGFSSVFAFFSAICILIILVPLFTKLIKKKKYIQGISAARRQFQLSAANNNQPPDLLAALNLLPTRPNAPSSTQQQQRNFLLEAEIDQLMKVTFQTSQKELPLEIDHSNDDNQVQNEYEIEQDAPQHNIRSTQKKPCSIVAASAIQQNEKKGIHTCSICDTDFIPKEKIIKLRCGHFFHIECIRHWLKRKNNCPNCRRAPFDIILSQRNEQQEQFV